MPTKAFIDAYIDKWCTADGVAFFHNYRGNSLFHMLTDWIASGGSAGPTTGVASIYRVTSAKFINATDCPLPTLNGIHMEIFYNEASRYLTPGTEWSYLTGGGFTVLIPGFDATAATYNFLINQATTTGDFGDDFSGDF